MPETTALPFQNAVREAYRLLAAEAIESRDALCQTLVETLTPFIAVGNVAPTGVRLQAALEINPDLAGVYWREMHMWLKADGLYPLMGNVGAGLEACGWDVPTDPGPEAFAPTQ